MVLSPSFGLFVCLSSSFAFRRHMNAFSAFRRHPRRFALFGVSAFFGDISAFSATSLTISAFRRLISAFRRHAFRRHLFISFGVSATSDPRNTIRPTIHPPSARASPGTARRLGRHGLPTASSPHRSTRHITVLKKGRKERETLDGDAPLGQGLTSQEEVQRSQHELCAAFPASPPSIG